MRCRFVPLSWEGDDPSTPERRGRQEFHAAFPCGRGPASQTTSAARAPAPSLWRPVRGLLADEVWCRPIGCRTATCRRGLLPRGGRPRVYATPSCRNQAGLPSRRVPLGLKRSTGLGLICQTCSELHRSPREKLLRRSSRGGASLRHAPNLRSQYTPESTPEKYCNGVPNGHSGALRSALTCAYAPLRVPHTWTLQAGG